MAHEAMRSNSPSTELGQQDDPGLQAALGTVHFEPFTLDLNSGELRRNGVPVPLRPLATRILLLLAARAGRLVTKEELRHALWGETAVEWEDGLHQLVRQLRRALGDDARDPAYIETVPRRGYRFCGVVEASRAATVSTVGRRSHGRDLVWLLAGTLLPPAALLLYCLAVAI